MGLLTLPPGFRKGLPSPKKKAQPAPSAPRPYVRSFQAANTTRLERSWPTAEPTISALVAGSLGILVTRSRHAARNSPHLKKFIQLLQDNVTGPDGMNLQAQIVDATGAQDRPASMAIEEAWRRWSMRKPGAGAPSPLPGVTRAALERLILRTVIVDGEAFVSVIMHQGRLAMQLISTDRIDPNHFDPARKIRHGIEYDENDIPIAYHVSKVHDTRHRHIRETERYIADRILHVFVRQEAGQERGIPWATSILWSLRMLNGADDALTQRVRASSATMGFFRDSSWEPTKDPATGEIIQQELIDAAQPGIIPDIGGKEFIPFDPKFPDAGYQTYLKHALQTISSGLCVSYPSLASDLEGVSYSSLRQGTLDERQMYKGLQRWFAEALVQPIYQQWLKLALLNGDIKVRSKSGQMKPLRTENFDYYADVAFSGQRWTWIDPQSEATALEKELAMGINSRSAIMRANGLDPDDMREEQSTDKKEEERLGLKFGQEIPPRF